jgi:hypothetical protein
MDRIGYIYFTDTPISSDNTRIFAGFIMNSKIREISSRYGWIILIPSTRTVEGCYWLDANPYPNGPPYKPMY